MPIIDINDTIILPKDDPITPGEKILDSDQTKTISPSETGKPADNGKPDAGKPIDNGKPSDGKPSVGIKSPHLHEKLLIDSRISPIGSGVIEDKPNCTVPTSGQKWWAAIILGVLFALISSPPAYAITSKISTTLGGMPLYTFTDTYPGQTLLALFIHTLIFILIVRILLW